MNSASFALSFVLMMFAAWVNCQQMIIIDYLKADNRMLRQRLKGWRLGFTDAERALLACKAFGILRKVLLDLGTIVTPDTLLHWAGRKSVDIMSAHLVAPWLATRGLSVWMFDTPPLAAGLFICETLKRPFSWRSGRWRR